jgi:hypothetical protein
VLLPRIAVVRFSVKLHNDARGMTNEVDHVSAYRCLSVERDSIKMMRLEIAP